MTQQIATTPFGRRPVTLGQIATRMQVRAAVEAAGQPGSNASGAINKWTLYRTLTEIKERLGLSDRSLSVLNALLSFQQEVALTLPPPSSSEDPSSAGALCALVVFPSNKALSLRAHGMSESTLRRHLAALAQAGLIERRDSPNGKRFARKGHAGPDRFVDAFGFDLTPLVARAPEFDAIAEELRAQRRELRLSKERVTLHRRDIAKLIACGVDEGVVGPWDAFSSRFMALLTPLRQLRTLQDVAGVEANLALLHAEIVNVLESHIKNTDMTGNDGRHERQYLNSNTQNPSLEPVSKETRGEIEPSNPDSASASDAVIPLGMVLDACPDILNFHFETDQVATWPAFTRLASTVRPMLGISPDAWRAAIDVMGQKNAAIAVAAILQRSEHSSAAVLAAEGGAMMVDGSPAIRSPGGYLRALTEQAKAGQLAIGPILMALIGQRSRHRGPRRRRAAAGASSSSGSFT